MISLAVPWALAALPVVAVPVLLHLVRRREPPEVVFPAVRYLDEATRDHRQRLRLQHLLLLLVRTLVLLALVLAAAGLRIPGLPIGSHAPTALALVLDNSVSSGVMHDGTPVLESLRATAQAVLSRATPADRLWLLTADGSAVAGSAATLADRVARVEAVPHRLALGTAISRARAVTATAGLPAEVVVVSDLQRSALNDATGAGALLLLHPSELPPPNRALERVEAIDLPWAPGGGRVRLTVASPDATPVPVLVTAGSSTREVLVPPGVPTTIPVHLATPGWSTVTVALPPDELRRDDTHTLPVRVAPPPAVTWEADDRYVAAALEVLVSDGRVRRGGATLIGGVGAGPSLVVPPEDAAQVGALNRRLAARGVPWQYGALDLTTTQTDSGALLSVPLRVAQHLALVPLGDGGSPLITVAGKPWLVQAGDILLVGSRFDPTWTSLPVTAEFVPLLDELLTRRLAAGRLLPPVPVGEVVRLPSPVDAVVDAHGASQPLADLAWSPPAPGAFFLRAGDDTVGALAAGIDPRESQLARAETSEVRALWPGATSAPLTEGAQRAFGSARGDLRTLLLALAALGLLVESLLTLSHRLRPA